jgi:hypothetical protein
VHETVDAVADQDEDDEDDNDDNGYHVIFLHLGGVRARARLPVAPATV